MTNKDDKFKREQAMRAILRHLRSPLSTVSLPEREAAAAAIKEYSITLEELLEFATRETWRLG